MKQPCIYILASKRNGTLYVGSTTNLTKRIWQHKSDQIEGFAKRYAVKRLVWYEQHPTMETAIIKERRIKRWLRKWKLELIEENNPDWNDLYLELDPR